MRRGGFTTVELLMTLFIAAAMVISGYQLYNAITIRNGRARSQSEASNIAYNILQQKIGSSPTATSNCTTSSNGSNTSVAIGSNKLPKKQSGNSPTAVFSTCRIQANLVKVTVTVAYDYPERSVSHAAYVAQ